MERERVAEPFVAGGLTKLERWAESRSSSSGGSSSSSSSSWSASTTSLAFFPFLFFFRLFFEGGALLGASPLGGGAARTADICVASRREERAQKASERRLDRKELALLTVEGGSVVGTGEGVLDGVRVGRASDTLRRGRAEEKHRLVETFRLLANAQFPQPLLFARIRRRNASRTDLSTRNSDRKAARSSTTSESATISSHASIPASYYDPTVPD